jgi:hypothetical protein
VIKNSGDSGVSRRLDFGLDGIYGANHRFRKRSDS